ncbi:type II secretion system secretin GspD, partial [Orrella sp. JC864]|uniref:type II secretion system secretin GspD n=1 Tax=Orrella sp. JC864 TaxID=3120298 RepID=UPI00300B0A1E
GAGAAGGSGAAGATRTPGLSAGGTGAAGTLRGGQAGQSGPNGLVGGSAQEAGAFSAGGVTVMADVTTNTLIISAPEPMYRSLRRVIDVLDQRRAQVLVESLIVEVTEDNAAELGIQWMTGNGRWFGGAALGGSGVNLAGRTSLDVAPRGLNIGVIDGTVNLPGVGEVLNLELLARALESRSGVNILSTPNLLTLDNEPAAIMVGRTLPFVSGQYITDGGGGSNNPFQTVEREDIGLKLNIRPQISEGGTVKLDIYQEVSTLDDMASANLGGIVTNKRAIDTSVLLDDGQIMVLGGLLEDSVQNGTDAVPVLGSIPVLGALFRYESRRRVKTNLMVFLRPYVVRDARAGRGLTQNRYDYMRRVQASSQPPSHPLLRDIQGPILPPAGLPQAGAADYDLRPAQWEQTRRQMPPETESASALRQAPAGGAGQGEPAPQPVRTRLPAGLTISDDPEALYGSAASRHNVIQFAQVREQAEALRIAQRARISGVKAYALSGPGGMDYVVRVDAPRDPRATDATVAILRELGYSPELVVTP